MTHAEASLVDGQQFEIKTETGHKFLIDAAPEVGGHNAGPRPMELVVAGIAGCTAMDVVSILRKMGQKVSGLRVSVSGDRSPEHPKRFVRVHIEYIVSGSDVAEGRVAQAIHLSETKYCSALASIHPDIQLSSSFRVGD